MNNQQGDNKLSLKEFRELKQLAQEQYQEDIANDPDIKDKRARSPSEIFALPGYNKEHHISLSYFLVKKPKTRKFLLEYFIHKSDPTLGEIVKEYEEGSNEVSEKLISLYRPRYLHRKEKEFLNKGFKEGDEVDIAPHHRRILEIYTEKEITGTDLVFDCYYYSTTSYTNKKFTLHLNLENSFACIEEFHDSEKDVYSGGHIHIHEYTVYISLERNVNKPSVTPQNDMFHLTLLKGKRKVKELDVISGSFLAISIFKGNPIASEVVCINRVYL